VSVFLEGGAFNMSYQGAIVCQDAIPRGFFQDVVSRGHCGMEHAKTIGWRTARQLNGGRQEHKRPIVHMRQARNARKAHKTNQKWLRIETEQVK
jgi:hypothetical protein